MRAEGVGSGARPPAAPERSGAPAGAFAAALARARRGRPLAGGVGAAAGGLVAARARAAAAAVEATALSRRRRAAEGGREELRTRRREAEPGVAPGAPAPRPAQTAAAGEARPEAARAAPLWPPGALDQLALAARRGDRPSLELSLGREVRVALERAARGVEVVLQVRPGLRAAAEAELPRLVAALGARGVPVARAEVRAGCPAGALTAPRGSATTATLQRNGTVAKW